MNSDMVNLANLITNELRAMCVPNIQLYKTGNMRASIATVQVGEDFIDIVIATDYASFTNERGKMAGWIQETIDRVCRAYASNNNVDNMDLSGFISYGG